jgi:fumarate reductase subunit D
LFRGKTDAEQSAVTASIKAQLLSRSSIEGASAASESIVRVGITSSGEADWDGHDTAFTPVIYQLSADEDYNKLLHLQLQQGRWFDAQQATDRHNFILNETAIGELNIHQPVLGQRFIFQQDTGRIIGVVKDFHFASLHEKINPLVIFNSDQWRTVFFIKTRPGKAAAALAATRSIWQRYVDDKPFEYTFLDEDFDDLYKTDAKVSTLILTFSLIAILISCLGLLGLAAFNAQQRVREIGIRKILGATVANIMLLLSQDFIRLVLLSVLIATPIVWYAMHRWLQNFAYHIPLTPWIFAGAGALATLIALVTIGAQSVRAATSNPVHSLRSE